LSRPSAEFRRATAALSDHSVAESRMAGPQFNRVPVCPASYSSFWNRLWHPREIVYVVIDKKSLAEGPQLLPAVNGLSKLRTFDRSYI